MATEPATPTAATPNAAPANAAPAPQAPPAAAAAKNAPTELPVGVGIFVTSHSHAIPVAGLLADQPELRTSELLPSEWQARLDAYLDSER